MQIPRWLFRSLVATLLVTGIVATTGFCKWWTGWPENTAREFLNLCAQGNLKDAAKFVEPPAALAWESSDALTLVIGTERMATLPQHVWRRWFTKSEHDYFEFELRTFTDVAHGKLNFRKVPHGNFGSCGNAEPSMVACKFTAVHGRVVIVIDNREQFDFDARSLQLLCAMESARDESARLDRSPRSDDKPWRALRTENPANAAK
jgi:hypothetical protein